MSKEKMREAEKQYPEGLYFGMPFDTYCELPYFSRSVSKDVIFDLQETKYRMDNPLEETPAMALGTAIHSMLLEPDDYNKTYVREPSPEDYPGKVILKTVEDFKPILKGAGEKQSGNKSDIIERAKQYINLNKFVIWDEEILQFNKSVKEENKIILSLSDYEIVEGIRQAFTKEADITPILQNGYPEVTIIWKNEETGMLCKCRLDYLRPEAISDVKSFSVKDKSKPLFEYLFKQTTYNYYNYQYAIYSEALEIIINKINAGKAKAYGEFNSEWMAKFLKNPMKQFFILYVRTAAPYQIKLLELQKDGGNYDDDYYENYETENKKENDYYSVAQGNWRFAINKFARAVESGIWKEKQVEILEDSDVPFVKYQSLIN